MSGLLVARRGSLHRSAAAAADYAAEVAADSPVGWWRFEETSGATVADEIGTNDGTVTGANLNVASFADTGSAASFDGTDDKIVVPDSTLWELTKAGLWTFECLVKLDNPDADAFQTIADKTDIAVENDQWYLAWDNRSSEGTPQRLRFVAGTSGDILFVDWAGTAARDAIAAGIHVACVKTADTFSLYANGDQKVHLTGLAFTGLATNDLPLTFGGRPSGGFWLGGVLDEPAVYDTALSAARILAHAQAAGLA